MSSKPTLAGLLAEADSLERDRQRLEARVADLERELRGRDADGQRLYRCLALFDRREGDAKSIIVQAVREGWERSDPEMGEHDNRTAWDAFDRLIDEYNSERPAVRA